MLLNTTASLVTSYSAALCEEDHQWPVDSPPSQNASSAESFVMTLFWHITVHI